jgi:mono/diheme cytochrome c family protein
MSNQTQEHQPTIGARQSQLGRFGAALAGMAVAGIGALWLGARTYDVGATAPHSSLVEWALRRGMETSVQAQAQCVTIPAGVDLRDPQLAERAIGHYSVACAQCHAAPGHPAAPWMVLYPAPADLTKAETVAQWTDEELYWIIKNGIKDTGMIALGPTHKEPDLWAVAAFVRQLPEMTSEHYHDLVSQYQAQRGQTMKASAHAH